MYKLIIPRLNPSLTNGEMIIQLLSVESFLTSKQIYWLIKRNGVNTSYQAMHKALKHLLAQKIIVKDSLHYSINIDWIEKLEKFCKKTKKEIKNKKTNQQKELFFL